MSQENVLNCRVVANTFLGEDRRYYGFCETDSEGNPVWVMTSEEIPLLPELNYRLMFPDGIRDMDVSLIPNGMRLFELFHYFEYILATVEPEA